MANESTGRTRAARATTNDAAASVQNTAADAVDEAATETKAEAKKPLVPKDIDPNQIITVRNGFQGRLVYKSRKTGERFVWDSFGAEQDMELGELKNARNSNKKYFINNWFMFDEPWIVDYIGMSQYYKSSIPIQDFDKFFEKDADEIEATVSKLSDGQKKSVAYRARQLIADGRIDSNRTISTLEKCLGVELVER